MLKTEVKKHPESNGFIFDGFPRTQAQASALDSLMNDLNSSITGMIALDVPEDELKQRLKKRAEDSGRTDDADPKVIANRIEVYKNETAPVKTFYKEQDKFHSINGLGGIQEITDRMFDAVERIK